MRLFIEYYGQKRCNLYDSSISKCRNNILLVKYILQNGKNLNMYFLQYIYNYFYYADQINKLLFKFFVFIKIYYCNDVKSLN